MRVRATDGPRAYWTKRRRFTDTHGFAKPNDERGLMLMDRAAMDVMNEYKDVVLAFEVGGGLRSGALPRPPRSR